MALLYYYWVTTIVNISTDAILVLIRYRTLQGSKKTNDYGKQLKANINLHIPRSSSQRYFSFGMITFRTHSQIREFSKSYTHQVDGVQEVQKVYRTFDTLPADRRSCEHTKERSATTIYGSFVRCGETSGRVVRNRAMIGIF